MSGDDRSIYSPMAWHLKTERLVLKAFAEVDAESYAELISERGVGGRGFGTTVQGARDKIAESARVAEESGIGVLAVHLRREDGFLGYCGLVIGRASIDEPEIAFELLPRAHGRGYATEAALAVIAAAKATGRRRLWAGVAAWNHPSFRVLEKTGFRRDHTYDHGRSVYLIRDL